MRTIVVIPARGGSKGIPRKNLRPIAGKPMIYYSIRASLSCKSVDRVVVSTDDDEIALFAERFGADVLCRPEEISDDITPLDPVISYTVKQAEERWNERYDLVVTVQPTSPLTTESEIESVVTIFKRVKVDTVLTVVDDRHLCWTIKDGVAKPSYSARVNRQQLPVSYKETGAIIACTREQIDRGSRIGEKVELLEVSRDRSIDIDTVSDLALCESILLRRRIVFSVIGDENVGMGHVYRALMIAHELVHYDIHFVCEESNSLAISAITSQFYQIHVCKNGCLAQACIELRPDMVINDILDTDVEYINDLKKSGAKVINFEDLGEGGEIADLVINALYPQQIPSDHVLVGPEYFCLRDEFIYLPRHKKNNSVERILLTFGGVDEGGLTVRCLELLGSYCVNNNIGIDVVIGPGFCHQKELYLTVDTLAELDVSVSNSTSRISDYMRQADLAITSGGRTVLELAAMHVPTIVICQNLRETTHTFASSENGIINLGYREDVKNDKILSAVQSVINDSKLRDIMREKLEKFDLRKGKKRVIKRIQKLLQD